MNEKIREQMSSLLQNSRLRRLAVAAGIIGTALIVASNLSGFVTDREGDDRISVTTYSEQIEGDLEKTIGAIQGAGKTQVLLTMENGVESVYLKDSATKTKEIQPRIRGVLVVCEGGDEPLVVERVTEAVCKALNISTAKVCVTKLSE
ncbi:MAG: hypothetical protein UH734_03395 [Ruminococcus sp.]|nr:hypothetical protein [Ruminococcus sp.]